MTAEEATAAAAANLRSRRIRFAEPYGETVLFDAASAEEFCRTLERSYTDVLGADEVARAQIDARERLPGQWAVTFRRPRNAVQRVWDRLCGRQFTAQVVTLWVDDATGAVDVG